MDWYNKILCVTKKELTKPAELPKLEEMAGKVVMSEANYKKMIRVGPLNSVRPGKGLGHVALIEYESLPPRFKERFEMIHGNPYEMIKESMMADEVVTDTKARDFFATHLLWTGLNIPERFQKEYVQNASVLNLLIKMLGHRAAMRKAMNNGVTGLWETIYGTVDRLREHPGHTLPNSRQRLRDKINEYKKEGYECLISGKLANKNTAKITEEGGTFLVMQKRRRVPVMSDHQIWLEYNRVAPNYGWKKLECVDSVTNYLNDPDNVQRWYDAVYGELKAHQKFGYKFKTRLPEFRDALWYGDGTKLNLYYKDYVGGKLTIKTTQVYEVMDAYSEMLLGYHISDTENYTAQYNAYRMAVELAQARPYEVVVDNQGGHKKLDSSGFLKRICRVQRNTAPYRASSKTIESVFGRFQSQILHQDWRFTGQNITTKSDKSRQNLEFVMINKDMLFTLPELKEAYRIAREEWNSAPHPATGQPRCEMYKSSFNGEVQQLDKLDMIEVFWLMTPKPATFTSSGITIQISNQKYTYDVYRDDLPDLDFRKSNIGRQFYTQYDPNDLTQVRLYVMDASGLRYVTDAYPYTEVRRALQEATHESSTFVRQVMNLEEEMRVASYFDNIKLETEAGVAPEQFGLKRPKMKGVSKKRQAADAETPRQTKSVDLPVDVGQYHKAVSNFDPLEMLERMY